MRRGAAVVVLGFGLLVVGPVQAEIARIDSPDLLAAASRVQPKGPLRVEGLALGETEATLELSRFDVFTPDAVVVVRGDQGETRLSPPRDLHFRGQVSGEAGSKAYLSVRDSGEVVGVVTTAAGLFQVYVPASLGAKPTVVVQRLSGEEQSPFRCDTDPALHQKAEPFEGMDAPKVYPPVNWTARMAIDTDNEFLAKFSGNTTNATRYIGNLFGYASKAYEEELATELQVTYLRLWVAPDPWTATTSGAALDELLNHWVAYQGGVSRTLAHMVASRLLGGGTAYIGVLCDYNYGFGSSGSIAANFNPNNPVPGWDIIVVSHEIGHIIVVSHEIGHNFNSRHTHDYCNLGGNSNPVDLCYNSAASCGSQLGLPGWNSLTGGTAGAQNGTFMSYCHLLSGGYNNIALRFGEGHPYGILTQRVPDRMFAHAQSRAAAYPACLSLDLIFRDGF